jgi:DNA helicase-2/ATP-dependent DNA helicase PcrA
LHSFGYKIIKRAYPRMRVNKHKLPDILLALLPKDADKEIEPINQFLRASAEKLVRMAKYNMSDLDDESLDYIADRYDVQLNDSRNQIFDLARHAYRASVEDIKTIDFDDMIFFVLAYNLPIAEIDLIIGDEIQDWNTMQQQLVMRAVANNRFIGVGDRYQSIYGFAGADINSIPNMIELLGKTTRNVVIKPLNETRRCPKSHVALASEIVPHIRAMDSAIDGEIYNIKTSDIVKHVKVGDLVISRRNAPLISIAYALLRNGIRAIVRGRDFATGLINLVLKFKAVSITELIEVAETYRTKELDKLNARGNKAENQIDALNDKIDTLIALTEGLDTVDQLINKLNTLFSDQNDDRAVNLSSVHRAKGLEAVTVFVADYDKIEIPMNQDWNQQQEKNLHYVALTRSKSALYLCQSDTKKKKK